MTGMTSEVAKISELGSGRIQDGTINNATDFWQAIMDTGYIMEGESRQFERRQLAWLNECLDKWFEQHPEIAQSVPLDHFACALFASSVRSSSTTRFVLTGASHATPAKTAATYFRGYVAMGSIKLAGRDVPSATCSSPFTRPISTMKIARKRPEHNRAGRCPARRHH
jgi:hypothetical protein